MNERTFPATYKEALALLYVKQNAGAATPEEYLNMYKEALSRILAAEKRQKDENPSAPQTISY